ncbi:hypothetical protein [Streptomyces somaliensis]|uniref:hypothetical protein n=1 Tax=Streptomyces somaliensis TaxID=78355 RepID=UPI0034E984AA|nr:hypothetical protein [Streptomyces somaliensis]
MQTTPPAASLRPGATDRVARAAAIAACLPYLALKAAWLAGGRVGIPEGSVLLEQPRLMAVANTVTLLMDTAVIVLALLLTQRWGSGCPPGCRRSPRGWRRACSCPSRSASP